MRDTGEDAFMVTQGNIRGGQQGVTLVELMIGAVVAEFVAGTGGEGTYAFRSPMRNSQARYRGFGVLRLELRPGGYTYNFVPVSGNFRDTGSGSCH
jgi:hypothetical protein